MINVCLFGCGRMGQDHAKNIHQSPFATLYSVVDPCEENARRIADKYGAVVHITADEALNDQHVDAVVIVSQTSTHTDLIIASAKAGKPIFCEKPIDLDLEKTDECLRIVREYGVPLFVGFNRRFDLSYRTLQQHVREGVIGPIEMLLISSRDAPLPPISYLKTSGGMFKDMTIHDFDIARWILQEEPTEVYASGSCLVEPKLQEFGDIDTAMLTLKTKSGAICHINNSRRSAYGYDQRIEVFGPHGMLKANNLAPTTVEYSFASGIKTDTPHLSFPQRYQEAYRAELNVFFKDVVIDGNPPEITGEDARQAMVIAEAANESLKTGLPTKIFHPTPIYT